MNTQNYKKIIDELIELIEEGVYIVDRDGTGIHYNHAMARMEKVNLDDVLGIKFHDAFPDFNLSDSTMYKALKKGQSTVKKQQTYKNLYGKEITTVNTTVPIIIDGEVIAAVEVARDITDLQQLSNTILELQERQAVGAGFERENARLGAGKGASETEGASGRRDGRPAQNANAGACGIVRYGFNDLMGEAEGFRLAVDRAKRAAKNDASVFIYGETGTGKELFAQSIHYDGTRAKKPFLAQNCAAIPDTLLEGMLFGTAKGGFTGAVDRAGLFEQANGGTLLLDEISAMPYELQSKLLRVLQENYIRRVGGTKDIAVNVRIVATVNENPQQLIEEGKLRKDLYYRLNVVSINLPSLRERRSDIELLANGFLEKHNKRFGKEIWMISDGALEKLKDYDYPGNVRELENIIEQAVSMADMEHVLSEKILAMPESFGEKQIYVGEKVFGEAYDTGHFDFTVPLDEYMDSVEAGIVKAAIVDAKGNVSRAAEALGIKRQTLQHKLKKYNIT